MLVRAVAPGFWDSLKQPGDEFEVPDGTKLGSWLEPVEVPEEKPAARQRKKEINTESNAE